VAAVPLQDVPAAVRELEHAVGALGLVGVEIGTTVNGRALDDPGLDPFFASAEALQVPVLVHPSYVGTRPGLEAFYFTNVLGNPLETTMAAMRLIAGGVLDRHPKLVLCLAHGGGFLPYQLGRLRHAATVRPELRHLKRSPLEYLNQFYFDSITHHPLALRYLIEWAGADRVMLGSDFPYDMGDPDPVGTFEDAVVGHPEWEQFVTSGTAKRLFRF
jgi:aminocarboxymuconate-semialdehyde decarboxylase